MCANEVTSHLRSDDAIQDFNDPAVATYMSRRDWFQYVTDFFPDEVKCSVAQFSAVAFMLSILKHLPLTSMRHVDCGKINPVCHIWQCVETFIYTAASEYGPFFRAGLR
jgi:hypothetical protein